MFEKSGHLKRWRCLVLILGLVFGCSESNPPVTPGSPGGIPESPEPLSITTPVRLSSGEAQSLLVADYSENKILLVDRQSLEPIEGIRVSGRPTCVAYSAGKFFVGNRTTGSVDVLDRHGNFLYYLGGQANLFGQVNDLAIDEQLGLVYVVDAKHPGIRVFHFDGSSAGEDLGVGTLVQPTGIFVDPVSGDVVVSDHGSKEKINDSSIYFFSSSGSLIKSLSGKSGFMGYTFAAPQGLFVDDQGYLFMAEAGFCQVLVLDPVSGAVVSKIGTRGSGDGELNVPQGVFVDRVSRDVFVSDTRNGRVVAFRGAGVVP